MIMRKFNILRLIYIPSAVAIAILISGYYESKIKILMCVGFFVGLAFCFIRLRKRVPTNFVDRIIGLATAVLCSAACSNFFYDTWNNSQKMESFLNSLLGRFTGDYDIQLTAVCVILALAAVPLFAYIFTAVCAWVVYLVKLIDFKNLVRAVIGKFSTAKYLKKGVAAVLNLVFAVAVGTAFLFGAFSLPVDSIEQNVSESASVMQEEGTYRYIFTWCISRLDNFTDSIMLLEAADDTDASLSDKVFNVYHGAVTDSNPQETLVKHYNDGVPFSEKIDYARYWHGYLVILKPLLTIMNYNSIRILNGIVQTALFAVICALLYKQKLKAFIIPYALCYLMLMPVALANSLQFSSCYYIFTVSTIVLLLLKNSKINKAVPWVFLNIGIAVAYFDFLTYPVVTFGIPAVFYLVLRSGDSLETRLGNTVRMGLCWCFGYGGMWASKWIVASVITGTNVIENAFSSVEERMSSVSADGLTKYTVFSSEVTNFSTFLWTPIAILVVVFCSIVAYKYICKKRLDLAKAGSIILPFAVIAVINILWYAFTVNHSSVHFWFTNKTCVTSCIAILFALVSVAKYAATVKREYKYNRNSIRTRHESLN